MSSTVMPSTVKPSSIVAAASSSSGTTSPRIMLKLSPSPSLTESSASSPTTPKIILKLSPSLRPTTPKVILRFPSSSRTSDSRPSSPEEKPRYDERPSWPTVLKGIRIKATPAEQKAARDAVVGDQFIFEHFIQASYFGIRTRRQVQITSPRHILSTIALDLYEELMDEFHDLTAAYLMDPTKWLGDQLDHIRKEIIRARSLWGLQLSKTGKGLVVRGIISDDLEESWRRIEEMVRGDARLKEMSHRPAGL